MEVNDIIGAKYEIVEIIKSSKQNSVGICVNKYLGNEWIIKCSPTHHTHNTLELKHLLMMDHPRIPKVIDVIHETSCTYYILEKKHGACLDVMCSSRQTTLKDLIKWSKELVLILQHIHAKGVVHGDLKPNNIIIDEDFGVNLIDFGSSFTDKDSQSFTIKYAAPERLLDTYKSDDQSDLYSFGILLSEMIQLVKQPYFDAKKLRIKRILKKCKQLKPEFRMGDADCLYTALCELE